MAYRRARRGALTPDRYARRAPVEARATFQAAANAMRKGPQPVVHRGIVSAGAAMAMLLLISGCAAPVRHLWPPRPDAPPRIIYVSLDTWHGMIAFPQETPLNRPEPANIQQPDTSGERKPAFEEWGYAERAWYLEGRQGISGALRALFWPSPGVIEVGLHDEVWAHRTPQPPSELFTFRLGEEGYLRLRRHLLSTIEESEPILVIKDTKFYTSKRPYHLFHQSHQYVAHALKEAGLPLSAFWAFSRGSLTLQLRRAARIAATKAAEPVRMLPGMFVSGQ